MSIREAAQSLCEGLEGALDTIVDAKLSTSRGALIELETLVRDTRNDLEEAESNVAHKEGK